MGRTKKGGVGPKFKVKGLSVVRILIKRLVELRGEERRRKEEERRRDKTDLALVDGKGLVSEDKPFSFP